MNSFKKLCLAATLTCTTLATSATATTLDPTDMRGIRESAGCAPLCLLDFSAVKGGTEDRTIAHFDISGLGSPVTGATLELSMQNQDGATFPSTLDIYSFAGDGTVSTDEFNSGSLFTTLTGILGSPTQPSVDITSVLNTAIGNGDTYLSFNLRNEPGEGRFFLGHVIGGTFGTGSSAGPTFIDIEMPAVPLPAGGALLVSGLLAVIAMRKRQA